MVKILFKNIEICKRKCENYINTVYEKGRESAMHEDCNKLKIMDKIFDFSKYVFNSQLTIFELYKKIIIDKRFKCEFYFCIIYGAYIYCYENNIQKFQIEFEGFGDDINGVEAALKTTCSIQSKDICFLKLLDIGAEQGKSYYIYGLSILREFYGVNELYLNEVNKVYGNWLQQSYVRLSKIEEKAENKIDCRAKKHDMHNKWIREINLNFYNLIYEMMGIDLDIINEVAGYYYERKECNSKLCILLDEKSLKYKVEFAEEILLEIDQIRMIRKVLEMVQEGQCLVIGLRDRNSCVKQVLGIAGEKECQGTLVFKIKSHLNWMMELNDEVVIGYRNGKYIIEHLYFKLKEFEENYKSVFDIHNMEDAKEIVREAILLNHGSSMIFIDTTNIKAMESLKYAKSVGFECESKGKLSVEKLRNISAIDGAIMLDKDCHCLKYGMILNSEQQANGSLARGSRYNSVLNYIQNCCEKDIPAMGVVVSEDRTVDIIVGKKEKENGK